MIDCLIVLNGENDEGFIKFEDNYKYMTCACSKKCAFVWVADSEYGEMKKCGKIKSPFNSKPVNCGIFELDGELVYPVAFCGDEATVIKVISSKYTVGKTRKTEEKAESTEQQKITEETDITEETEIRQTEVNIGQSEFELNEIGGLDKSELDKSEPHSFWDCNERDFLRIMDENPADEEMNMLIPGSRWARVKDGDSEYVMGVILNEESMPMYLCYGFALPWSEKAPEKLDGYSQWIPKDCSDPHGEGFWVIYINAKTGERVR